MRVYDTVVTHARTEGVRNVFSYRSSWWLVDLAAPPQVPAPLRPFVRFEARDHLGDPDATIADNVVAELTRQGIAWERGGRITMLTTPRSLGGAFNPITVFWCHRADGGLAATLVEVHNTYGGRHVYVIRPDSRGRSAPVPKRFYVSPFYPVEGEYRMALPEPDRELGLVVTLHRDGAPPFVASVRGTGRPTTTAAVARAVLRSPAEWVRSVALIRAQGLLLWARKVRLQPLPAADTSPHDVPQTRPQTPSQQTQDGGPMTRSVPHQPVDQPVDPHRWPDVAALPRTGIRTAVAHALVGPLLHRLPLQVLAPGESAQPELPAVVVHRPDHLFRRLGAAGTTGFGESYMAGDWDSDDLAGLLEVFADRITELVPRPLQRLRRLVAPPIPGDHRGSESRAQANVSAHYDLSNDLFATFLDPSMTYSSALFDGDVGPGDRGAGDLDALARGQARKLERILDSARVGPGSRVLEIGTGWGELAVRAGRRGAEVDTITLSVEQAALARDRIAREGLADRVRVHVRDYRDTEGRYDAVVSVEMIEAVGDDYWPVYFRTLAARTAPGGRAVLQSILMPHQQMLATRNSFTWIQKYIFPGGLIPSRRVIDVEAQRAGMAVVDSHTFGQDYARTLAIWRQRFEDAAAPVAELGFDETFRRMWSFYLAFCEAGFRAGYLDVQQIAMEAR